MEEGLHQTLIEGVHVFKGSQSVPRAPMVYRPPSSSSAKDGSGPILGARSTSTTRLTTSSWPCRCRPNARPRRRRGSPSSWSTSTSTRPWSARCCSRSTFHRPRPGETPRGISSTPMNDELAGAVIRLLECLKCPTDSRLLGRQMVREVVYRVLRGEQGKALLRAGQPRRPFHADCPSPEVHPFGIRQPARDRRAREAGGHERLRLPPPLQARDGLLAAPIPQTHPPRPRQDAHDPDGYNCGPGGSRRRLRECTRSSVGSSRGSSA